MMINQTIGQKKMLQEAQDKYERAWNSPLRQAYLRQHNMNMRYLYGDQFSSKLRDELNEIGAIPLVINRIEPIITTYTSLQINARRKITIRPTTEILRHEILANHLDNLLHTIQQQTDFQNKSTQKYTDALVGGLGWTQFGYDNNSHRPFFYDSVNPDEMAWDPDDQSQRLDNSEYNVRSYFVSLNALKRRYSNHAKYFEELVDKGPTNYLNTHSLSEDIKRLNIYNDYQDISSDSYDTYNTWTRGRAIRIVEVYYKKNAKYYETEVVYKNDSLDGELDEIEQYFCTFDEELAKAKRSSTAKIKELEGTQIWKVAFCDQLLLESGPLPNQIPNQVSLPITPLCLKRNYLGLPYGVVDGLIAPSTALNYIWTKTIHGLDSKYLIMEKENGFDIAKDGEIILNQLSLKRGILSLKDAGHAQLINSENLLPLLFQALQRIDVEFEQRTQLFDELKGDQTNAVSGVAIQQRALNAARTQNPLNATYEYMLKTEGQLMLDTIKGIKDFKYTFNYFKDEKINYAKLDDEIATINFEVYTDTSGNLVSSKEEEMAKFEALMDKPNYAIILSNPVLIKKLGFSDSEAESLSKAFLEGMQATQQPQQPTEEIAA